ncbi:hypothetical protein TNCV_2132471 [Trichonephila clavipes]|nr:hypothetical protein TNCV_2132471 [Trichonephila clavipes]
MKPYHDPAEQTETEDIPPKESYKGPITRSRIKTLEQNDSGRCLLFRGEQCRTHNLLGPDSRVGRATATAGSDVIPSGRQFSMTFSNICGRISAITRRMQVVFQNGQAFVAYPHRPMTLHSPTENSLGVKSQDLEANSQVQNVKFSAVTKRVFH